MALIKINILINQHILNIINILFLNLYLYIKLKSLMHSKTQYIAQHSNIRYLLLHHKKGERKYPKNISHQCNSL
jgi:hypothetical protein